MRIDAYNKINEALKNFIFLYQKSSVFSKEEFEGLHKQLLKIIEKETLYEDLRIRLINAHNEIMQNNNLDFLAKDMENSYHIILWKIHDRIIKEKEKKEKISIRQLPKELREFNRILGSKKIFLKEDNIYYIISLIGCANGHITNLKIFENHLYFEYNDHSPSRTQLLRERMTKVGWNCSKIKVLKDIFPKKEGADNYFFTAEKERKEDDLRFLAIQMDLMIDTDWLLLDETKDFTQEEFNNELLLMRTAFMLWDIFGINPRAFLNIIRNLLVLS